MFSDKRARRLFATLLLLLGFGGASAFAQFSSGIEGIAHDTTGAVIAGAKVTVTDTRLGVSKIVVTGQNGYFRVDGIAASTYTVEIQMAGFQTWKQAGLTLQIAEIRTLTPELKVGDVSTNVEVSATAASVDLVTPTHRVDYFQRDSGGNAVDRAERLRSRIADARHDRRRRNNGRQRQLHKRIRDQSQRRGSAPGRERIPDRRRLHQHALPRRRHIDLSESRDRSVDGHPHQRLRCPEGKERRQHGRRLHRLRFQPVPREHRLVLHQQFSLRRPLTSRVRFRLSRATRWAPPWAGRFSRTSSSGSAPSMCCVQATQAATPTRWKRRTSSIGPKPTNPIR